MKDNKNNAKRKKQIRKTLEDAGLSCRGKSVRVTCSRCGKIRSITTNDISIYTEEIRNNYICLFCK